LKSKKAEKTAEGFLTEAVIDTNVIVSGLLRADSPPGEIIDLVFGNIIIPIFDDRILYEYRDVLMRPKFAFPAPVIEDFLSAVAVIGRQIVAKHTHVRLPDEKDRCFYECALSAGSKTLITGNKKHFPEHKCPEIVVFSPSEFLKTL
jgi:putative PIN family toxin of toxin-antitoxin system